jgi:methionyl-tRNA formyltransferase
MVHRGEPLKLFDAGLSDVDTSGVVPGTIVGVTRADGLLVACRDRAVRFGRVQRPNKGPVPAWQWAQAVGVPVG